eukprot:276951-Rhodomonas_salina.2
MHDFKRRQGAGSWESCRRGRSESRYRARARAAMLPHMLAVFGKLLDDFKLELYTPTASRLPHPKPSPPIPFPSPPTSTRSLLRPQDPS